MIAGQLKKMDILFYNSIQKNKKVFTIMVVYHIIQFLLMVIFVPIDTIVLQSSNQPLLGIMITAIILSFLNFLSNLYILIIGYGNKPQNNLKFLQMAQNGHLVNEDLDKKDLNDLSKCVSSTVYNQQNGTNINDEGLTQQLQAKYQNVFGYYLQEEVTERLRCCCNGLFSFGSVICFIIMIVFLAISAPSVPQIIVCVIWLVFQLVHWKMMLITLLIALSPLIVLGVCFWACCCAKQQGEQNIELPPVKQATMAMIMEAETCMICQQSFTINERVYQLKCASQHIFHEGCLRKWLSFGKTCPTCRKPITAQ